MKTVRVDDAADVALMSDDLTRLAFAVDLGVAVAYGKVYAAQLDGHVVALDARTGAFDDGRRVPGARMLAPTAKDAEVTALLPDKKALVVTYCTGLKCPASHMLGEKLRAMGYVNVLEYHEGIDGWAAAGNAVEQVPK